MGAAKLKAIHEVRKRNLNKVIEARFDGNASAAAKAVDRSHTFMWQLVGGYRGIGERIARHIEAKLELGANALDAAKAERTTKLVATDGKGATKSFPVVPVVKLDLLERAVDFIACPVEYRADADLYCAVIEEAEDVVEVQERDRVYFDRRDVKVIAKKLYVVQHKGKPGSACVLMARKAGTFGGTGDSRNVQYTANALRVVGRVILIVRELAK